MGRRRKHLGDPNLCRFPAERYTPVWADGTHTHGYREVADIFHDALMAFFPKVDYDYRTEDTFKHPVPTVPDIKEFYPHGSMSTFHLLTPEQQELASALYREIGKAIHTAYQNGLDHGRSLLAQLAAGEVTLADFDEPHRKKDETKIE